MYPVVGLTRVFSFGEPGYEERETLKNGLKTAARSGFTAVAVNSNTNPVIDTKSAVEFSKKCCTRFWY